MRDGAIHDLLDGITVIFQYLKDNDQFFSKNRGELDPYLAWQNEVSRILEEQNLAYRLDEDAIVHPFVDEELEVNRASTLAALSEPRFAEARRDFEAAYRHLRHGSGKEALRMMFPAVEVAAKVLFPGRFAGLAANEVDRHILPALDRGYAGNQPAITAGRLLLGGMKSWINASHLYRHGQEQQEPAEPPIDFVIAHLSAGATYLRWMIELCSDQGTGSA
jgi:hypothetical protein